MPRIDTFYVDIFSNLSVLTGTPATNPTSAILSGTQLFVMDVRIEAGATIPSGLDVDWVYLENTPPDWAITSVVDSYVSIDVASTDLPATGSKRIKITTNTPDTEQSKPLHRVGDKYQGGVIIWLSADGSKGIIIALTDITANWWSRLTGANSVGAGGAAIGDGLANTNAMMGNAVAAACAAKGCTDYKVSILEGSAIITYSDWVLPSQAELYLGWINKDAIGNFKSDWYWSSTEISYKRAVGINFGSGSASIYDKNNNMNVRPIRYFDDSAIPINVPVPAITLRNTELLFTSPEPVSVKNGVLSFNIKSSIAWRSSSAIIITAISDNAPTGVVVMKQGYMLGYKPDDSSWQMVAIQMSKFSGDSKTTINKFRFNFKFEWPNLIDIGLDDIRYQHTTVETETTLTRTPKTDYRFEELPDGVRVIFTTLSEYIDGTVELYVNGQKQIKGVGYFEEEGKIRLTNVLDEYDSLMCNYYTYK